MKNEEIIDNLCLLISAIEEFKKYYTEAPNDLKIYIDNDIFYLSDEVFDSLKEAVEIIERIHNVTVEHEFTTKEALDNNDACITKMLDLLVGKLKQENFEFMVSDVDFYGNVKARMSIDVLETIRIAKKHFNEDELRKAIGIDDE